MLTRQDSESKVKAKDFAFITKTMAKDMSFMVKAKTKDSCFPYVKAKARSTVSSFIILFYSL